MSPLPESCVVDASVGIKLLIAEDESDDVRDLFQRCIAQPDDCLFVPDLFFIECANILWKKVRRGELAAAFAADSLADLRELLLPSTPTSDLMEHALEIACAFNITAYDACYIALAAIKGIPLLTADAHLADVMKGSNHDIVVLRD